MSVQCVCIQHTQHTQCKGAVTQGHFPRNLSYNFVVALHKKIPGTIPPDSNISCNIFHRYNCREKLELDHLICAPRLEQKHCETCIVI